jgi:hypothetical protein
MMPEPLALRVAIDLVNNPSRVAIFGALSPHPKIPFPAAGA